MTLARSYSCEYDANSELAGKNVTRTVPYVVRPKDD